MTDFLVMPDLEAIASTVIRGAAIPGLVGVYSSIPAKPTYPLAVVKRLGGRPPVPQALDAARIQVDVLGGAPGDSSSTPTKGQIHDIAQLARVALLRAEGQSYTSPVKAFITAVRDEMGITWSPDNTTKRDRYIFAMFLYGQPLPPVGSGFSSGFDEGFG
jgi:hypothetical protein